MFAAVVFALAVFAPGADVAVAPAGAVVPVFAGAASRGVVDGARVERLRLELARQFTERGARVVVPVAAVVSDDRRAQALREFETRLTTSKNAFAAADYAEARSAAVEALQIFEKNLAYTDDEIAWSRYRELLVIVAEAQLTAKDVPAADATLSQVLAVDPDYKPAAQKPPASPELSARIDALRAIQKGTSVPVLEVQSRPPGAKVLIDGRGAGRAPVAVDVAAGIHYVLIDDNGRVHTERLVVSVQGARVTARLGSPEAEAAATLTRRLRDPLSKKEFTDLAHGVADVVIVAVIVPWGRTEQVLCARVTNGELDAVIGTRLPLKEGPREKALFALVDAALKRPDDGWVFVDDNAGILRQEFLQGVGDPEAVVDEDAGSNIALIVGGIAGGAALVVGAGIGAFFYFDGENKKDTGFTYGVDVSGL